ncbi:MAG: ribosome maturation factor RimP [Firmicutes bacterium]|nr:ribosome maturation factor RimP [Bacillota bacterium]
MAEPLAERLGLELVDVELTKEAGRRVLRFLIDKEGGVTLNDCEAFSRLLDPELDLLDPIPGSYDFQVSSPGVERPLKKESDYQRFSGRPVRIKLFAPLEGKKVYEGILQGLAEKNIFLEVEGETVQIPLEIVAKANLIFQ